MGLLLMDVVGSPQDHPGFRAAWRNCPAATVVKHLDVDAPQLFKGLHEQDLSGKTRLAGVVSIAGFVCKHRD